jgi:hypothetical protein
MTILCCGSIQPQNPSRKRKSIEYGLFIHPHCGNLGLWETYVEEALEESFLEYAMAYGEHNLKCLI